MSYSIDKEQQRRIDIMEKHYATLNSEMSSVKTDVALIKQDVSQVKFDIRDIKENIGCLKKTIFEKPTWLISGLITLLISLVVYLLTNR